MNEYERYGDHAEQKTERSSGADPATVVRCLLIGMGVGAAVALLLTPMSGRELRNAISQGCRHAFDSISEQTRNLRERGSNLLGFNRKAAGSEYEHGTGM